MLIQSDARQIPLKGGIAQCVVTSPPYWGLRNYGTPGQLGLERTPEEYVQNMVAVFREVWRVMRDDGVLWLNLGDTMWGGNKGNSGQLRPGDKQATNMGSMDTRRRDGGCLSPSRCSSHEILKVKDMVGIPWRVAFALQADGWYLRSDCIWSKPNPMPESVTDRPTKSHEYIFLLTKRERYFWDQEAVGETAECGRLRGSGPMSNAGAGRNDSTEQGDYRIRRSQKRGEFGGKTESMAKEGRNAFRAILDSRNIRTVWNIATEPYSGSHFATFPRKLVEICIKAGSRPGDIVFDPFVGSGTVVMVSRDLGRCGIGCDLTYHDLSKERIYGPLFAETINA